MVLGYITMAEYDPEEFFSAERHSSVNMAGLFEIEAKNKKLYGDGRYTVYGVRRRDEKDLFLIYRFNEWEWIDAENYCPCRASK